MQVSEGNLRSVRTSLSTSMNGVERRGTKYIVKDKNPKTTASLKFNVNWIDLAGN